MSNINPRVLHAISKRYQILEIIDLLEYDQDFDALRAQLSKFKNMCFQSDQRILIFHHDTDYYPGIGAPGFTVYNLSVLLKEFMIPNEFLIILTNHYGIREELHQINKNLNNNNGPTVIYTSLWFDFPDQISQTTVDYTPSALYCCLNRVPRSHRLLTLSFLKERNLLANGILSYHFSHDLENY